ncbi:Tetracyclin repressor domain-containing protein [Pseudofrankia inefficax]|uniref:Tetracyclin repressor domain-containing protein n=1 Tax=Pseudofrankia inefficax (strain DSM 45817 / CECT 9037 / DDB 130130 / EuI1c) TaxID=298654 RepID=E3J956_PSEI1|nr:Tetracyclin repressor domain-containing protein [Pseudofrankia inefficax]
MQTLLAFRVEVCEHRSHTVKVVFDGEVQQRSLVVSGATRPAGPGQDAAEPAAPGSARWWAERVAAARRRRPRVGGLSTERVVAAALEVMRSGGVDTLTVRAVADHLGTSSGSLYRHIASRDELIALIADHVLGDIRLVRTGRGWRHDVEGLMRELRRVLLTQPLPASTGRNQSGYGPNALRLVDAALGRFLDAGLAPRQAAFAASTVIQYVAGVVEIERSAAGRGAHGAVGADGFGQLVAGLPADQFAALRTAGDAYVSMPADEVFSYGMSRFLDGIASEIAAGRPDGSSPATR